MNIFEKFRLNGKTLFISGGSRGLGRSMALAIADAGADVILTGRDKNSLEQTASEINQLGQNAYPIQADMSNPIECEEACNKALKINPNFNILINNIGGRRENIPTEEMTINNWHKYMDLNLTHAVLCTKLIGGNMLNKGNGGRIINISSINAFQSIRGLSGRHYETAKAALVQFTKATAIDWAQYGITVNCICPGVFMTEPNIKWSKKEPEAMKNFLSKIPTQTTGEPDDLGPLAVYISSDSAKYMTGSVIVIDGGQTC